MTKAEEKCPFDIQLHKDIWCNGYQQAEKDIIEKAVTWWSNNLVESEPTKGHYISAFKKYMENKEDKK